MSKPLAPMVSVIMPTYNCGRFIAASIRSVLAQTVTDWELQIVDDCSTDDTREVVAAFTAQSPRIHYTCLGRNGGPAVARNEALRRAAGRYIAFLDSDDLWLPDKLERQIAFMEKTGVPFTATAYRQMDESGCTLPTICLPPHRTSYHKMLRLSNPIGNSTVMYDQDALGPFEVPPIRKRNDFALWLKILKKTPVCAGMDDVLTHYRVRTNSVSSNKLAQAKYHWQLYRRMEKLGVLRSTFYLGCWAFVKGTGIGLRRRTRSPK
ncbi:MAG: glycosyltransferase family 2 protein [Aristaeellaceae bacterium]